MEEEEEETKAKSDNEDEVCWSIFHTDKIVLLYC